jgi:hypothetical protein
MVHKQNIAMVQKHFDKPGVFSRGVKDRFQKE